MNEANDHDLHGHFLKQRQCDREHAPAWRPELLNRPTQPRRSVMRWLPWSLATACVIAMAVFMADSSQQTPKLSDLPPLLDSPPGELFASLSPSFPAFEAPSDFLLPTQLIP